MLKRFTSLVLSLLLVFSLSGAALATDFADVNNNTNHEEAITLLADLDVIRGYNGYFRPEAGVTRAEMATFLVRILGFENLAVKQTATKFNDVSEDHWASGYIAWATNLGLIYGYGNGKFGPEDSVTYEQAITMILRALGYTDASLKGEWPLSYMYKALELGMLEDLNGTGSDDMPRGEVAQVIYNALDENFVRVSTSPFFSDSYIEKTNETLIQRIGIVKNDPIIVEYNAKAKYDTLAYLGENVVLYTDSKKNVVSVYTDSVYIEGKYDAEGKVFLTETGNYKISTAAYKDAIVVDNLDTVADKTVDATFLADAGRVGLNVELSGNTITAIYSVIEWTDGTNKRATKADLAYLDKARLAGVDFATGTDGKIDLTSFVLNGVSALEDIKVDDVITIYQTKAGKIARIDVNNQVITGEVSRIGTKDGKTFYTINGVDYNLATGLDALDFSITYTAYLDYNGVIVSYETVKAATPYIGIYSASEDTTIGLSDSRRVQYFNVAKNGLVIDNFKTKGTFDGYKAGDIFTYATNSDGVITTIAKTNTATSETGFTYNGSFFRDGNSSNVYRVNADTVVIAMTDTNVGYELSSVEALKNNGTAYNTKTVLVLNNTNTQVIAALVVQDDVNATIGYAVINDTMVIAGANNTAVGVFSGYLNGVEGDYRAVDSTVFEGYSKDATLYKVNYVNTDISKITAVEPTKTSTYLSVIDNSWYVIGAENAKDYALIAKDVVVYEYDTVEKTYIVNDNVLYGASIQLYEVNNHVDGYDVVIWWR